jgi:hypothetical protein
MRGIVFPYELGIGIDAVTLMQDEDNKVKMTEKGETTQGPTTIRAGVTYLNECIGIFCQSLSDRGRSLTEYRPKMTLSVRFLEILLTKQLLHLDRSIKNR